MNENENENSTQKKQKRSLTAYFSNFRNENIFLTLMVFLQPACILLSVCNRFRSEELGNLSGVFFTGLCLGFLYYRLYKKLKISFNSKEGILFLISPGVLFLLTFIESELLAVNFNSIFFWLFFCFFYVIMGAVLFLKSHSSDIEIEKVENKTEFYIAALGASFFVLLLFISLFSMGIAYSPDSYSYYDISRSVFSKFGSVGTIRQYVELTDYGISFPYLFPMLIAVFDFFTGFGIFSGTCVNIIATLVSFYYILKISAGLTKSAIPGLITAAVLLVNPDYLWEMISARAVPLSLLCVILILNIVTSNLSSLKKRHLFLIGMFAGAGMVVRFDFLAISFLIGVILIFVFRKNLFRTIPFYILGLLVFTSPWIAYSFIHFGKLWISDNGGTIFLMSPQNPQRFFTPDEVVPTFFTDWKEWFMGRQNIVMRNLTGVLSIVSRPLNALVLLGMAGAGILAKTNNEKEKNYAILLWVTVLIYFLKTMLIAGVGYGDLRYHAETMVILSLMILCGIYRLYADKKVWAGFLALIFFAASVNHFQPALNNSVLKSSEPVINIAAVTPTPEITAMEKFLTEYAGPEYKNEIRLFFIGNYVNNNYGNFPYAFGAYTGIKSYSDIRNINEERLLYLIENHIKPNIIYAGPESNKWIDFLSDNYLLNPISEVFPLYKITARNDGANVIYAYRLTDNNWRGGVGIAAPSKNIILFKNTEINTEKLKNAKGLKSGEIYMNIAKITETDDWIHVICEPTDAGLERFAYPNEIMIVK